MKWFKHLTGALNDNLIFEAIEKFGGDGYLVFFGTLEIMADEFDPFNPGTVRIPIKKLTKNFQLSRQKTVKILAFFDQKAKEMPIKSKSFLVVFEKNHVIINSNRLAELCDEHTQKLMKKNRESIGSQSGITPAQEVEVEVEVEKKKNIKKRSKDFMSDSIEYGLADFLFCLMKENNPKAKEPNMQTWAKGFDAILRIDGRTEEEVRAIIKWSQKDTFWMKNILSPDKLRKQYDRLILEMNTPTREAK